MNFAKMSQKKSGKDKKSEKKGLFIQKKCIIIGSFKV